MALSLKQSCAVSEMAEALCGFLPGSGNPEWKGHVSFKSVADQVGVGEFWQPGSKRPMIAALLRKTLETRRDHFERLVLEIVRCGLVYRQNKGNPVTPEEIDLLNGLIVDVGFKFPDLWDPEFRASLQTNATSRAKQNVDRARQEDALRASQLAERNRELEKLKDEFLALHDDSDRQRAGLQLERILNRLFALNKLSPREPFRVVGEQIDGSFELDHETYLIEAKWTRDAVGENQLLVFRGKIEGKSPWTRGVFISINGVSGEAQDAITRGKQPNFFIVNGYDIVMLLQDCMDLPSFLRKRQRILAEEGRVLVAFQELQS